MEKIQFIQVTPQQLEEKILTGIKTELSLFLETFQPKGPDSYLTRKEVSDLFKVDISTVHNWCKSGRLKPYQIGARVYFKMSDIESSLIPIH